MFHRFIDILRTSSSINSIQLHIHVYSVCMYVYIYMYVLYYSNKLILYTSHIALMTIYSYMCVGCNSVLHSFNQFACIHKPIDLSSFPLLYTQCLITCECVCVCVCAGERNVLLLCSVMTAAPVP